MTAPTAPAAPAAPARPLLKTPDITPAQIGAAATAAVGLAVALGVPISHDKQLAIEVFVVSFAPILIIVDAWIRQSRAKYVHTALVQAIAAAPVVAAALAPHENGEQPATPAVQPMPSYIR